MVMQIESAGITSLRRAKIIVSTRSTSSVDKMTRSISDSVVSAWNCLPRRDAMVLKESASSPNSSLRAMSIRSPKSCAAIRRVPSMRRSSGTSVRRIWVTLSMITIRIASASTGRNRCIKAEAAANASDSG